jgi:undecaprenyl diphosphate synthase
MGIATRDRKKASPPPTLPLPQVPGHVAIIMDGNGRWAQRRGLPRMAGHRAGTDNVRRVIERFADYGVRYLTLYAFSTENWNRPKKEVRGLLSIIPRVLKRETKHFNKNGIKLVHIGDLEGLSEKVRQQVLDSIELTKDNDRMTVCVAFNYGGRAEIVDAVKRIVEQGIPAAEIDDALINRHLFTAEMPDPDLIIRTAGEMRLSNFLLWQAAYAEFVSMPIYWPDFDVHHIDDALLAYGQRIRRFGGLAPNEADRPSANGKNGSRPDGLSPGRANGRKSPLGQPTPDDSRDP